MTAFSHAPAAMPERKANTIEAAMNVFIGFLPARDAPEPVAASFLNFAYNCKGLSRVPL